MTMQQNSVKPINLKYIERQLIAHLQKQPDDTIVKFEINHSTLSRNLIDRRHVKNKIITINMQFPDAKEELRKYRVESVLMANPIKIKLCLLES